MPSSCTSWQVRRRNRTREAFFEKAPGGDRGCIDRMNPQAISVGRTDNPVAMIMSCTKILFIMNTVRKRLRSRLLTHLLQILPSRQRSKRICTRRGRVRSQICRRARHARFRGRHRRSLSRLPGNSCCRPGAGADARLVVSAISRSESFGLSRIPSRPLQYSIVAAAVPPRHPNPPSASLIADRKRQRSAPPAASHSKGISRFRGYLVIVEVHHARSKRKAADCNLGRLRLPVKITL